MSLESVDLLSIGAAFITHAGSRHLTFDLTDAQKTLLSHPISKIIIMFAMFYVSTRSVGWSITLLLLYYLAVNMLFNENHDLNVLSPSWLEANGHAKNTSAASTDRVELYTQNVAALL